MKKNKIAVITSAAVASAAYAGLLAGSAAAAPLTAGFQRTTTQIAFNADAGTHAVYESTAGKHDCKGKNSCKGQGGCKTGDDGCKGKNSCKGKGGCKTAS